MNPPQPASQPFACTVQRRNKPQGQRWPPLSQHAPEPAVGHTLKEGDVVVGRVIRSHAKGANIELLDDPRILG